MSPSGYMLPNYIAQYQKKETGTGTCVTVLRQFATCVNSCDHQLQRSSFLALPLQNHVFPPPLIPTTPNQLYTSATLKQKYICPLRLAFLTQNNTLEIRPSCDVYEQLLVISEYYFMVYMYHSAFNHQAIVVHFGCFQLQAVTNKTAMSNQVDITISFSFF